MTGSADCRDIRHALGVYVLGAIDPAERATVDSHLSSCPECREELAGLAGLPALLRRIPVDEAQQLADEPDDETAGSEMPSEQVLDSLLARTSRARQVRRWRGLAAAAAVVLVAGAAGAASWSALNPPAVPVAIAHWDSSSAANAATNVSATIRYTARSWGTAVDTQVDGVPEGVRCSLVVTDAAGQKVVAGSWKTSYDEGKTWYTGGSSVMLDSLRSFSIISGGRVLVTVPAH
jgi:predicted anti-sigma-YlaC factor YlaD